MKKYTLTIKSPDSIDYFLRSLDDDQLAEHFTEKFFKYGEYVTIEIDTFDMTARVVPNNE